MCIDVIARCAVAPLEVDELQDGRFSVREFTHPVLVQGEPRREVFVLAKRRFTFGRWQDVVALCRDVALLP